MGKRQAQQKQIEVDEDETTEGTEVVDDLLFAKQIAKKMFDSEDPKVVFGVYDTLISDTDDLDEKTADLRGAYEFAKELFEVEKPTPEMTFGVFKRVFLVDEDEDEDEDGDE